MSNKVLACGLQLQKELSPDYEVLYFSQKLRKVISHPSELMAAA